MATSPPKLPSEAQFLADLIQTAYLPVEVPPVVTAKYFSEYCRKNIKDIKRNKNHYLKEVTNYSSFSAPRTTKGRRSLALVHPIAQLRLSLVLAAHRKDVANLIHRSGRSLYRVTSKSEKQKAFEGLDFKRWRLVQAQTASECEYILKADISRFFYTVYTHSLPWAVLGKEKAKALLDEDRRKLDRHWSAQLDFALQRGQSRETFGIPVGPDTSRIVAELLLAGVENDKAFARAIEGRPSYRLMDDFVVGFDEEAAAERAMVALRNALWKYSLQLNDQKTHILHSSQFYEERWKLQFSSIPLTHFDEARQVTDVHRLVDLTLQFCAEAQSGAPASFACRRLSTCLQFPSNFRTVLDAMFRLARDFPSCMHLVATFLINNRRVFVADELKGRIVQWVEAGIRTHLHRENDTEVAWFLLVAGVFGIRIEEEDLAPFDKVPSALVLANLFLLREKGCLAVGMARWSWRASFNETGIHGPYWLPFYEAVLRKWTTDKRITKAVEGDPFLKKLLRAEVTFLEDRIFEASHIDVQRRVFSKSDHFETPKALGLARDTFEPEEWFLQVGEGLEDEDEFDYE